MTTTNTKTPKTAKTTPTAENVYTAYADALKAVANAENVYNAKPTKTNGKALATAKRRLAKVEKMIDEIGVITPDNVQTIGERIAIRALKTCYQKGGQPFIYALYCGLIADITENKRTGAPLSNGYDIAQTACAYLCEYIGKGLHDKTADGQTDKDGNPVDVLRGCFRAVNRYIMGERQREYKRVYVDEIDEKTGATLYYEIPEFYDIPTATDYKRVADLIGQLDLPQRQKQVLRYRLRGLSVNATAQKMGITKQAVQNLMRKLQAKAKAIGLAPVNA